MQTNKKLIVLVGGGRGIGYQFGRYLVEMNFEVICITRSEHLNHKNTGVQFLYIDLKTKINDIEKLIPKKILTIIYLAHDGNPRLQFNDEGNMLALQNTIEGIKRLSVDKFIYISTSGKLYDPSITASEESEFQIKDKYTKEKIKCEQFIKKNYHGSKIRIVRPTNIYGLERDTSSNQGIIDVAIAHALKNKEFLIAAPLNLKRNFLYIKDFNSILYKIILDDANHEKYDVINVCSEQYLTLEFVLNSIKNIFGLNWAATKKLEGEIDAPINDHGSLIRADKAFNIYGWRSKWTLDISLKDIKLLRNE